MKFIGIIFHRSDRKLGRRRCCVISPRAAMRFTRNQQGRRSLGHCAQSDGHVSAPSFRGALLREPGIHNHGSGLWIPGLRLKSAVAD